MLLDALAVHEFVAGDLFLLVSSTSFWPLKFSLLPNEDIVNKRGRLPNVSFDEPVSAGDSVPEACASEDWRNSDSDDVELGGILKVGELAAEGG